MAGPSQPGKRPRRRIVPWLVGAVVVVVAVAVVVRGGDDRRTDVVIPSDVQISVEIDGQVVDTVDAARLRAMAPDHRSSDLISWSLTHLFADQVYSRPDGVLRAELASGDMLEFREPSRGDVRGDVALFVTGRGEVAVGRVDDRGGQSIKGPGPVSLGLVAEPRQGDVDPVVSDRRVRGRDRVRGRGRTGEGKRNMAAKAEHDRKPIRRGRRRGKRGTRLGNIGTAVGPAFQVGAPRGSGEGAGAKRAQNADGGIDVSLGQDDAWSLDGDILADYALGEGEARSRASLREILDGEMGPGHQVIGLIDDRGEEVPVSAQEWSDAGRVPAVGINPRGYFEFNWTDTDGVPIRQSHRIRITGILVEEPP